MKKLTRLALIAATFAVSGVKASDETGAEIATGCASTTQQASAVQILEKQMRAFNQTDFGLGLKVRAENGSLILLRSGVVSVDQSVSSPNFGKSRDFAYAKALTNLQAKFILKKSSELQVQIVTEEYNAEPSADDFKLSGDGSNDNAYVRIGDKVLKLAEAKLDNALREEGHNEDEIESAAREKKIDLFRESIKRESSRRAFGKALGLIPVKTMEAVDCNGRAGVSVVAVYSEKNEEFVKAVLNGHSMKPDQSRAAKQTLQTQVDGEIDNGSIVYEWGIRKLYDEVGYPILVSYGQWGYVPQQGMAKMNERRRQSALNQADAGAVEQLTLFLNSQASFLDKTSREQFVNSYIRVTETEKGTVKTEEDITEYLEKSTKAFSVKGKVKLTGLSDPMHWDLPYPHESAQSNIVGSVLYWSPRDEDAINTATGKTAERLVLTKPKVDGAQTIDASKMAGSKVRNNVDDF